MIQATVKDYGETLKVKLTCKKNKRANYLRVYMALHNEKQKHT